MENTAQKRQLTFVSERKNPDAALDPARDSLSNPEKHAIALTISYTWGGGGGGVEQAEEQLEQGCDPILCPCGI